MPEDDLGGVCTRCGYRFGSMSAFEAHQPRNGRKPARGKCPWPWLSGFVLYPGHWPNVSWNWPPDRLHEKMTQNAEDVAAVTRKWGEQALSPHYLPYLMWTRRR